MGLPYTLVYIPVSLSSGPTVSKVSATREFIVQKRFAFEFHHIFCVRMIPREVVRT